MLYRVPVLLVSFMVHELSHAYVAYRCGDDTAKRAGRISVNPIRHIDPIGAIMLLVAGFGWAKPVPINPDNFNNKRKGIILTSLAGPFSNILLAIVFSVVLDIIFAQGRPLPSFLFTPAGQPVRAILNQFYVINIALAAFNLIPIPPLDGSKVLFSFLPDRIYFDYVLRYERYGMFLLIALSISGFLMVILGPVMGLLVTVIRAAASPISELILGMLRN